jgi:hypothetical protein
MSNTGDKTVSPKKIKNINSTTSITLPNHTTSTALVTSPNNTALITYWNIPTICQMLNWML